MLIGWDQGARGIWWVLTKDEKQAPAPPGHWSGTPPSSWHDRPRSWSDRLSGKLLDDLQAWNDACAADGADTQALQERGRELALQVQDELGTDMHRPSPTPWWTGPQHRCSPHVTDPARFHE